MAHVLQKNKRESKFSLKRAASLRSALCKQNSLLATTASPPSLDHKNGCCLKMLRMKLRGILHSSCKVEIAEKTPLHIPLCIHVVCQHVRVTHFTQAGGKGTVQTGSSPGQIYLPHVTVWWRSDFLRNGAAIEVPALFCAPKLTSLPAVPLQGSKSKVRRDAADHRVQFRERRKGMRMSIFLPVFGNNWELLIAGSCETCLCSFWQSNSTEIVTPQILPLSKSLYAIKYCTYQIHLYFIILLYPKYLQYNCNVLQHID